LRHFYYFECLWSKLRDCCDSQMKTLTNFNPRPQGRPHITIVFWALVITAVICGACDKYEPTKQIEGVYRPARCLALQGIIPGGGWQNKLAVY